ncbi:MAG: hypothetical protein JXQ29_06810 [Planctomycetes bacterium]|nr:hypothetical protein [Planctomycetota bacterium]
MRIEDPEVAKAHAYLFHHYYVGFTRRLPYPVLYGQSAVPPYGDGVTLSISASVMNDPDRRERVVETLREQLGYLEFLFSRLNWPPHFEPIPMEAAEDAAPAENAGEKAADAEDPNTPF